MIEICPKCKHKSYIKLPPLRMMRESFGISLHIANAYRWKCHNRDCNFKSEYIVEKTEIGEWFSLPLWKRLFTKI